MAEIEVEIRGLKELRQAFRDYPKIAGPILAKTVNVSLANIHKETGDDRIFQFITPRAKRTGFLSLSFGTGIKLATPQNLQGRIGPTVFYAPFVAFGTRRGIEPNPYMERIVKKVTPNINKLFVQALDLINKEIVKRVKPI